MQIIVLLWAERRLGELYSHMNASNWDVSSIMVLYANSAAKVAALGERVHKTNAVIY